MDKSPQGFYSNSASCNGSSCTHTSEKINSSCEIRFDQKPWVGSQKPSRDTCLAQRHTWCSANKHNRTTCLAHMEFQWIALWHSINSTLSRSDSPNKHSKKLNCLVHLVCCERNLRKQSEMCFIGNISFWSIHRLTSLASPTTRANTCDTCVKQTTRNKRKERNATTRNAPSNPAKKNCCRSTQIWKQNWESYTSRDTCLNHDHTGCVVDHHADLLGKTWYKNWRLDPHRRYRCDKRSEIKSATTDPPPPSTQTHCHELLHRTTRISWKNQLLWNSLAIFNLW